MEALPSTPISRKRGWPTSSSSPDPTPSKRQHPLPQPSPTPTLVGISPVLTPDPENEGTVTFLNTYIRRENTEIEVGIEGRAPTHAEPLLIRAAITRHLGAANILKVTSPQNRKPHIYTIPQTMVKKAKTLTTLPSRPNTILAVREVAEMQKTNPEPTSTGILHTIPIQYPLMKLKMDIIMTGIPVENTYRVLTKQGQPTKMVRVTFDLPTPPTSLTDPEGRIHPVHPCRIPYLRCNKCQKHGHTTDKCPSDSQVCPHCAGSHTYDNCMKRHNPNLRKCADCSSTNHEAAYERLPSLLKTQTKHGS